MSRMASSGRVTAVVFDIGGVLLDWDPRHLYRHLVDDPVEREQFLAEVCTTAWNVTLDEGRPIDEACAELAAAHPAHAELIHAWRRQSEMIAGEIPGTSALVAQLRERAVPRYLLTNMPAEVFDERLAAYEVLQQFDGAVVSGRDGVLKPRAAAFELVARRFEVEPERTLFVDDSLGNVEGARAAGFQAHHFTGAAALERLLLDLGLLV